MPDHPDDAPKKPQRGVLPPFFAPRSGRGEAPPTPANGSWRRVSRLFTPPDVARQRGSSGGPLRPFTPPSTPAAEPPAASELPPQPGGPGMPTDHASLLATPAAAAPEATLAASPLAAGLPFDIARAAEALTLDDIAWPAPDPSEVAEGDRFVGGEPGGADALGDADLVVESLEPTPISLAIPDPATAGADAGAASEVWEIEHSALDAFDERADVAHAASTQAFGAGEEDLPPAAYDGGLDAARPEAVDATVTEYGALSRRDDSWGAGQSPFIDDSWDGSDAAPAVEEYASKYASLSEPAAPATLESSASAHDMPALEDDLPVPPDEIEVVPAELSLPDGVTDTAAAAEVVESEAAPAAGVTSEAPTDPWTDVDLPESTFGGSGWPQAYGADAGLPDWPTVETAADVYSPISEEPSLESPDPLGATAEGETTVESESVDEMSAALAWNESEAEDTPAAAAFGTGERTATAGEDTLSSVAHELRGISSSWAPAATSAEIADALARVAERIRAGEVELSAETAGASDESALAAALAALLRGPRQR